MASYDEGYWRKLLKANAPTSLMGSLRRMVENQEQKVTIALVDDLAEHDVLEDLLEESKPPVRAELRRFDYLLQTPWRYPPLPWGSRFGRRFEPSLFYGSLTTEALFSEAAYYRLIFLEGMSKPFQDRVISQHTMFHARYQTDSGYDLTQKPFSRRSAALKDKANYSACQALGTALREQGIEAVLYHSARTATDEVNVALFDPQALRSRKHLNPRRVLCETRFDGVQFRFDKEVRSYAREVFLTDGKLPAPAP